MALPQTKTVILPLAEERRRFQRVRVNLLGRYMLADRREFPCQVTDMSPGGMAVIAPVSGQTGERIIAYVDHLGRLEGLIARQFQNGFAMTVAATISGAIGALGQIFMFQSLFGRRDEGDRGGGLGAIGAVAAMILAPLAASLVQMAISRSREYAADKAGAEISGNPQALASALQRISGTVERVPNPQAEGNPATAHMFIINPLIGGHGWDNLFATHPSTENRIAALQQLGGEMGVRGGGSGSGWGGGSRSAGRARGGKRDPSIQMPRSVVVVLRGR